MNKALDTLISKTITSKANLSSLNMCLNFILKTDADYAFVFFDALCEFDISKAVSVASHLSGISDDKYLNYVHNILKKHCKDNDEISPEDLTSIIEYNDYELFECVMPKITQPILDKIISDESSKTICRLLEMCLLYGNEELTVLCKDKFNAFLSRYDSSGDIALKQLLPVLFDNNEVAILAGIFRNIGLETVEKLYDGDLMEELIRLTINEDEGIEIWSAYFNLLFRSDKSFEELLEKGLWHIQLYCPDELINEAGSAFYLYCAKHLGTDHEIFSFIDCFNSPESFSRENTLIYQELLNNLWAVPSELVRFIDTTKLCNPFIKHTLQDEGFTLIRTSHDHKDYDRLVSLFESGANCETIIKIFLCTALKNNLPMDDLLYLSLRYNVLDKMLEVLKNQHFSGTVTKHNGQLLIVVPIEYNVRNLHSLYMPYYALENIETFKKDLKGKVINYYISGYYNEQIHITIITGKENLPAEPLPEVQKWQEAIESLETKLLKNKQIEGKIQKRFPVLSFNLDSFAQENDFDLFTNQMINHPEFFESYINVLNNATWNRIFLSQDVVLPARYYAELSKYTPCATQLFQDLFNREIDLEIILDLYFNSIYKVIVPFNHILEMCNQEELLPNLSSRTIYLRMRDEYSNLCRPINMSCAPVCEMNENPDKTTKTSFPAFITNFEFDDGTITKIKFSIKEDDDMTVKDRGALFGFLALNEHIGIQKSILISKLPSIDNYECRELVFNLQLMEKAIILRRSSGEKLTDLLYAMDNRNPYTFQFYYPSDINYLLNLYSENNKTSIVSSAESIVLNSSTIKELQCIWLNTHIKYYISIPEYCEIVKRRRPELASHLYELFDGTEFICTADNDGYLWFYGIPQKSVYVGKEYGGMYLRCSITPQQDGLHARVISAQTSKKIIQAIVLCIIIGYVPDSTISPHIYNSLKELDILNDNLQNIDTILTDGTELINLMLENRKTSDYDIQKEQLSSNQKNRINSFFRSIHSEMFSINHFQNSVCKYIRKNNHSVPLKNMEKILASVSKEIMQCYPNSKEIITYLYTVFKDYSYYYRDNRLVHIWINQLRKYFGDDVANTFKERIRKNQKYQRNNKFLAIEKGDLSWMNL